MVPQTYLAHKVCHQLAALYTILGFELSQPPGKYRPIPHLYTIMSLRVGVGIKQGSQYTAGVSHGSQYTVGDP